MCVQSRGGAYEYVCMCVYMYGFLLVLVLLDTVMGTCLEWINNNQKSDHLKPSEYTFLNTTLFRVMIATEKTTQN